VTGQEQAVFPGGAIHTLNHLNTNRGVATQATGARHHTDVFNKPGLSRHLKILKGANTRGFEPLAVDDVALVVVPVDVGIECRKQHPSVTNVPVTQWALQFHTNAQ